MQRIPNSDKRLTREHSARVCVALAEVIPSDRFLVTTGGMSFDGIQVVDLSVEPDASEAYWYFDNTWAGEDGYTDKMRVYYTTPDAVCNDDHDPADAPEVDADPITIAKWIVSVVEKGAPA